MMCSLRVPDCVGLAFAWCNVAAVADPNLLCVETMILCTVQGMSHRHIMMGGPSSLSAAEMSTAQVDAQTLVIIPSHDEVGKINNIFTL